MRWFSIDDPTFARFPMWMRTFGMAEQDGGIHLPAALAGPEDQVLRRASNQCVPWAIRLEHAYLPADWLAAEFPQVREVCRKLLIAAEQVRPTVLQTILRYLDLVGQCEPGCNSGGNSGGNGGGNTGCAAVGDGLDDTAHSRILDRENHPRQQIADTLRFVPIALGRRVLASKGIEFSDTYLMLSADGQELCRGLFRENPTYVQTLELPSRMLPEAVVRRLAMRSPEVVRLRDVLRAARDPAGLRTLPVSFFVSPPTPHGLARANERAQAFAQAPAA